MWQSHVIRCTKKSIWSYFILLLVVITGTSVVSGGAIILPTLFQCHSLQTLAFLIEWNVTSHPALLSLLGSFEMNRKRASHHYFVLAKKKGGVASLTKFWPMSSAPTNEKFCCCMPVLPHILNAVLKVLSKAAETRWMRSQQKGFRSRGCISYTRVTNSKFWFCYLLWWMYL